jgi:hypothetical protein
MDNISGQFDTHSVVWVHYMCFLKQCIKNFNSCTKHKNCVCFPLWFTFKGEKNILPSALFSLRISELR